MGRLLGALGALYDDQEGQAVVEYVLMLSVMVMAFATLSFGLRKTLFKLWGKFAQQITAACPGCPADQSIRL